MPAFGAKRPFRIQIDGRWRRLGEQRAQGIGQGCSQDRRFPCWNQKQLSSNRDRLTLSLSCIWGICVLLPTGTVSPLPCLCHSKRRTVLFAQIFLLNLPHGVSWNIRGYEDALWLLVFCQVTRDC